MTGPVRIDNSVFSVVGNNVDLDILIERGFLQMVTPWTHEEHIGVLPLGWYNLTVQVTDNFGDSSTHFSTFQVVPEPIGALLIGVGCLLVRRIRRTKS